MIFILLSLFLPIYTASSMGMGLIPSRAEGVSITGVRYYSLNDLNGMMVETDWPMRMVFTYLYAGGYREYTFYPEFELSIEDLSIRLSTHLLLDRWSDRFDFGFRVNLGIEYRYMFYTGGFTLRNAVAGIGGGEFYPEEEAYIKYYDRMFSTGFRLTLLKGSIDAGWGMQVDLNPLILRLGFRTSPFVPGFGFGIKAHGLIIDMGFESHPVLGITECITIRRNVWKSALNM